LEISAINSTCKTLSDEAGKLGQSVADDNVAKLRRRSLVGDLVVGTLRAQGIATIL
jgi:hypothetical protein